MASGDLPEWAQWVQAGGVLVIAVVGTVIAWQQKETARQQAATARQQMVLAQRKLQHDLFDRRFKVFEAARHFLAILVMHARATREQEREFFLATGEARFLLDDGIHDYFEGWGLKTSRLRRIELQLENLVGEDQRRPLVDEKDVILVYFVSQTDGAEGLIERFRPYLSLRHE